MFYSTIICILFMNIAVSVYHQRVGKMTDTRKQKAEKASEMPIKHSLLAGNVQIGSVAPAGSLV